LLVAASCVAAWCADDSSYPSQKVRLIVPYAAGGPTDVVARIVAENLSKKWGQQVYVENILGAGGNVGVEAATRASADGYTVLVVSTGFIVNPTIYTHVRYDPLKDFEAITLVATTPNVVSVNRDLPAKSLQELIALIRQNPGKYSYAQSVTGSTAHLAGELFKQKFSLDLVMVPFNGAPPALNSTLGGYTPIAFTALPPAVGFIRDGTLRGIAVLSKHRVAVLPELPTSSESGVADFDSDTITGLVAPSGTPKAIIEKLQRAIAEVVREKEVQQRFDALGFIPVANTSDEFKELLKAQMARWGAVAKAANMHVD
jgi:tripartite-type tricarboxylate transporter receptor subunit TctC